MGVPPRRLPTTKVADAPVAALKLPEVSPLLVSVGMIEAYPSLNTNDVGYQLLNGPGWGRFPPNPPDWVQLPNTPGGVPARIEDYPPISTMGVGWQTFNQAPTDGPLWLYRPNDPSGWVPVGNLFPYGVKTPYLQAAIIVQQPAMPPGGVFLLQEDGSKNFHNFYDDLSNTGLAEATISVLAMPGPGAVRYLALALECGPDYTNDFAMAIFDVAAGTVTQTTTQGNAVFMSASCVPATDGFFACSLSASSEGGVQYPVWGLSDQPTSSNFPGGQPSYQGDGSSGLYMHDVSLLSPPPPLTGNESDGTNFYPVQVMYNAGSLVSAPTIVAPDGTTGAVQAFQEDGTFNQPYFGDFVTAKGLSSLTISAYVKAGARRFLCTFVGLNTSWDSAFIVWDCQNGVIVSQTITNGSNAGGPATGVMTLNSATIQAAANGFWKISVSLTCTGDTFLYWYHNVLANVISIQDPAPPGGLNLSYQGTAGLNAIEVWRIKATTP